MKLKPLCQTRRTVRTRVIETTTVYFSLEEMHETTHDNFWLKASGLHQFLEMFYTVFGFRLAYYLFAAAENVSLTLQRKYITLQDALTAIDTAKCISNEYNLKKNLTSSMKKRFNFLKS